MSCGAALELTRDEPEVDRNKYLILNTSVLAEIILRGNLAGKAASPPRQLLTLQKYPISSQDRRFLTSGLGARASDSFLNYSDVSNGKINRELAVTYRLLCRICTAEKVTSQNVMTNQMNNTSTTLLMLKAEEAVMENNLKLG